MKKKIEKKKLTKRQELIRRRRAQMLVHSCLYYEMDSTIISDDTWQKWADELEQLQSKNPKDCNIDFFDYEFRDWTGATGSHLPHRQPWVYSMAQKILNYHEKISK
jgi:NAD-dependent DNA ligase